MGLGYFCIAALITVSQGWLNMCSDVQILILERASEQSGAGGAQGGHAWRARRSG